MNYCHDIGEWLVFSQRVKGGFDQANNSSRTNKSVWELSTQNAKGNHPCTHQRHLPLVYLHGKSIVSCAFAQLLVVSCAFGSSSAVFLSALTTGIIVLLCSLIWFSPFYWAGLFAQRERAQQDSKVPYKVPHLTHPPFTYERQPQHRDHPTLTRIVRGFFNVSQNYQHSRNCETGPPVYRPYPRRLESLNICRWNYKGSTFLLSYLKTLSVGPVGVSNSRPPASQPSAQSSEPPVRCNLIYGYTWLITPELAGRSFL